MNSDFQGKPSDTSSALAFHMFVSGLAKDPNIILAEMTPERMDLVHAMLGIAGEVGELIDAVKKVIVNNKELDRTNVVEELGDLNFYMQMVQQRLFISDAEIMQHNMKKLGKRYAEGYSDAAAQARADKVEEVKEIGLPAPLPLAVDNVQAAVNIYSAMEVDTRPVAYLLYAPNAMLNTHWSIQDPDGVVTQHNGDDGFNAYDYATDRGWRLELFK